MPTTIDTCNLTYDFYEKLRGTMLGKSAEYALEQDEQACKDFLIMMYEQLTGDAAHATVRTIGSKLAEQLRRWAKQFFYDKYRDAHFTIQRN